MKGCPDLLGSRTGLFGPVCALFAKGGPMAPPGRRWRNVGDSWRDGGALWGSTTSLPTARLRQIEAGCDT
jgi:hypothetical protein